MDLYECILTEHPIWQALTLATGKTKGILEQYKKIVEIVLHVGEVTENLTSRHVYNEKGEGKKLINSSISLFAQQVFRDEVVVGGNELKVILAGILFIKAFFVYKTFSYCKFSFIVTCQRKRLEVVKSFCQRPLFCQNQVPYMHIPYGIYCSATAILHILQKKKPTGVFQV